MIEFIDKTNDTNGTPLNRANMMGIQGFEDSELTFNDDGSIVETNSKGHTLTTIFNNDGSIVERFEADKTITKITRFSESGVTSEVVV